MIAESYAGPKFDGPVEVQIMLSPDGFALTITPIEGESKLRGDTDNYVKTILDALNDVAWDDDKAVLQLVGVKY